MYVCMYVCIHSCNYMYIFSNQVAPVIPVIKNQLSYDVAPSWPRSIQEEPTTAPATGRLPLHATQGQTPGEAWLWCPINSQRMGSQMLG